MKKRFLMVLCQIVLVNINLINAIIILDDENHPFIMPLTKNIRETK